MDVFMAGLSGEQVPVARRPLGTVFKESAGNPPEVGYPSRDTLQARPWDACMVKEVFFLDD